MRHSFRFEDLDVYILARDLSRWMRRAPWPPDARHLQGEAIRAADSVVLNIAEGVGRGGKSGQNHIRIAKGSAGEAFAALDVADFAGCEEQRQNLRRIGAMLSRLRPR